MFLKIKSQRLKSKNTGVKCWLNGELSVKRKILWICGSCFASRFIGHQIQIVQSRTFFSCRMGEEKEVFFYVIK